MNNPDLIYKKFHSKFYDQSLDLSNSRKTPRELQQLNEITSVKITRIESDIWYPQNEFEFALIMHKYGLDYSLNLPEEINYPFHVQLIENRGTYETYILENLITECGGVDAVEDIIKKKPHQAAGYTPNYHGYKGYIFSKNTEWRMQDLKKPYGKRSPFAPMNVLRNAFRLLSNNLKY